MLKIVNHRLQGDNVAYKATPNVGGALVPRYLVMHYTAGSSAASSIASLCTQKPQGNASAHIVLARDGTITQLAPFNVVTWHAGVSQWNGIVGLNSASIGIEIDNAGPMNVVGDKFIAWFGREYPASDVLMAAHKHGGPVRPWHAFTAVQIERALELADLLTAEYGLVDILGHDDIARGRKQDPGPAFPLASIAARALGRGDDAPARFVVTADELNIRKGPDAAFDKVAPALRRGAIVALLEPGDRWSKVEVEGDNDIEGWVNNSFIVRVQEAPRSLIAAAKASPRQRPAGKKAARKTAAKKAPRKTARARR
ncbi:MAG TPA: N-acetylmuramoyl-L-alanine amidase [Burkholderiaceae bacterium]|nr:N-acetylmuramoyl-L-alanine amidase [Burkholderiaceae bacterium]